MIQVSNRNVNLQSPLLSKSNPAETTVLQAQFRIDDFQIMSIAKETVLRDSIDLNVETWSVLTNPARKITMTQKVSQKYQMTTNF